MWIEWFVLHLSGLRHYAAREALIDLAYEVYPHVAHLDPIQAAQAEFDAPPPHRIEVERTAPRPESRGNLTRLVYQDSRRPS